MKEDSPKTYHRSASLVEQRVGVGQTEIVAGWQDVVTDLLRRAEPFTQPGTIITFQRLKGEESAFFERLLGSVQVPPTAMALYLPPSVRSFMMGEATGAVVGSPDQPPDAGVLLARPRDSLAVCVNALFAHPPFTPAVDVYETGQMIAGYQYADIDGCLEDLTPVLRRHLG